MEKNRGDLVHAEEGVHRVSRARAEMRAVGLQKGIGAFSPGDALVDKDVSRTLNREFEGADSVHVCRRVKRLTKMIVREMSGAATVTDPNS